MHRGVTLLATISISNENNIQCNIKQIFTINLQVNMETYFIPDMLTSDPGQKKVAVFLFCFFAVIQSLKKEFITFINPKANLS